MQPVKGVSQEWREDKAELGRLCHEVARGLSPGWRLGGNPGVPVTNNDRSVGAEEVFFCSGRASYTSSGIAVIGTNGLRSGIDLSRSFRAAHFKLPNPGFRQASTLG